MCMKKVISLMLVILLAFSVCSITAFAQVNDGDTLVFQPATENNAFGELLNWNGIVFEDVSNINSVEGTFAVGGNVVNSSTGLSINGGIDGLNPSITEDVSFLVNKNVVVNGYGNVWGQTVIGNKDGNTYNLSNITPSKPDGWPRGYTVANSSQYFEDAKNTAYNVKNAVEALTTNGSYEILEEGNTVYNFKGDKSADVLIYNITESNFNSYRFDFNIADNQTVILNFTAPNKIQMNDGAWSINGVDKLQNLPYLKGYNRNIIINIANAQELELNNCDMYGTLLAPNTVLKGTNGYVCGTSILKSIDCPQGWNGFGLLLGGNSNYIPLISNSNNNDNDDNKGNLRIDAPHKMAVVFEDGSTYYGGEMKEIAFNKEYHFQMCTINWSNDTFDDNNGLKGTVVYTMEVVHNNEFKELASLAKADPDKYTVKGIDIIDNVNKKIIVNGDAEDAHLETDVNNFFMAYRFYFTGENYNHQTGIDKVIYNTGAETGKYNKPLESLSVNLPLGTTVTAKAYQNYEYIDQADILITKDEENPDLCYKDYYWNF